MLRICSIYTTSTETVTFNLFPHQMLLYVSALFVYHICISISLATAHTANYEPLLPVTRIDVSIIKYRVQKLHFQVLQQQLSSEECYGQERYSSTLLNYPSIFRYNWSTKPNTMKRMMDYTMTPILSLAPMDL